MTCTKRHAFADQRQRLPGARRPSPSPASPPAQPAQRPRPRSRRATPPTDNCANVADQHRRRQACTITNTLNSATFTVNKDFSDNSAPPGHRLRDLHQRRHALSPASGTVQPRQPAHLHDHRLQHRRDLHGHRDRPGRLHRDGQLRQRRHHGRRHCRLHDHQHRERGHPHRQQGLLRQQRGCRHGLRDLHQRRHAFAASGNASRRRPRDLHDHRLHPGRHLHRDRDRPRRLHRQTDNCAAVAISNGGTPCTITNTLNSGHAHRQQGLLRRQPRATTVSGHACTNGGRHRRPAAPPPRRPRSHHRSPASTPALTCTATETRSRRLHRRPTNCTSVAISRRRHAATCTITNTLNSATFTVNKFYSRHNGSAPSGHP